MKQLLLTLLLLASIATFGQTWNTGMIRPAGTTSLQTPNNISFQLSKADTVLWAKLGTFGDYKLYSAKKVRQIIDSLALHGADTLAFYRLLNNHDSLINLEEKSYLSLDDLPSLSIYRKLSDHDSLSTLQEKNYSSLDGKPDLSIYVPKTTTVNGHALGTNVTVTKADVLLGNVSNDAQVKRSEMAAVNGVATLDANGKLPTSQVPSLAITDTYVVTNPADRLALTLADRGDVAIVTSENKSYILQVEPYSVAGNWKLILTPTSPVNSVNGQTGNISLTTTDIAEGANKYYTDTRVVANSAVTANTAKVGITTTQAANITANNAKTTNVTTNLGYTASATNGVVTSSDGTNATLPLATGTNAGLLSPAGFTNLGNQSGVNTGNQTLSGLGGEPAFTKNTGFNKNFGSVAGTVLEGRTFGTAANNATGDFEAPLTFSTGLNRTGNTITNTATSSSGLSDGSNLAKLNAANTFTQSQIIRASNGASIQISNNNSGVNYFSSVGFLGLNGIIDSETSRITSYQDANAQNGEFRIYNRRADVLTLGYVMDYSGNHNFQSGSITTSSTIQATTAKLTSLTDGYIPYHVSDAVGLANSPISTDGTKVGIGTTTPIYRLDLSNTNPTDDLYEHYIRFGTHNTLNSLSGGLIWETSYIGYDKISAKISAVNEDNYFRQGLAFYTGNVGDNSTDAVERVRIGMDGNVDIGYGGTRTEKLAVNGSGYFNGGVTATGLQVNGNANVTGTTASTSPTTGALTVAGGLGVGDALNVGGVAKFAYASGIRGTGIGIANVSYFSFYESNGTTRQGYIGFGASGTKHLYITNDISVKQLILREDGILKYNGGAIFSGNITAPSLTLTTGAGTGKVLTSDGTGNASWATLGGAAYKGEMNGATGAPIAGGSALVDGAGTSGWYYACSVAGTHNYGSGNITLAIGDQLYSNGSVWLKIPGAGSYTLPVATASTLGGVKQGAGTSISVDGTISVSTAYEASGAIGTHAASSTAHPRDTRSQIAGSYLSSFTETDPNISAWARASTKPSYTKSEVGLGNVDNTSDASKPISTATQTALNLKANLASPSFTGTVTAEALQVNGNATATGEINAGAVNTSSISIPTQTYPYSIVGSGSDLVFSNYPNSIYFSNGVVKASGFYNSTATANTIAYFDGSRNISSLPTNTYPNLTELSRVKGVTSSIQTQLNGKAIAGGNSAVWWHASEYYLGASDQWLFGMDTSDELVIRYGRTGGYSMYGIRLSQTGIMRVNGTVTTVNAILSDERLKENIKPIETKNIDKVQLVQFSMKSDSLHNLRTGVIAQELEELGLGQYVITMQDSMKTKAVNYTDMLIAMVADLRARIEILENQTPPQKSHKNRFTWLFKNADKASNSRQDEK